MRVITCRKEPERLTIPKVESSPPPFHVIVGLGERAAGDVTFILTKWQKILNFNLVVYEEVLMYKGLIAAVIIVLMSYGGSLGQCDQSISATYQDDLPVTGSPFNPCGNWFSYVFEFDIEKETSPFISYAIVYPQVITSSLNLSVNSWRYHIGDDYQVTGDNATGSGSDYLKIGVWSQSEPDVFSNMDWSVHYYNDEPD